MVTSQHISLHSISNNVSLHRIPLNNNKFVPSHMTIAQTLKITRTAVENIRLNIFHSHQITFYFNQSNNQPTLFAIPCHSTKQWTKFTNKTNSIPKQNHLIFSIPLILLAASLTCSM